MATRQPPAVYENLDTSYLNLAALLRYLRQREFVGRIHVELDEYDADIFLNAREEPHVRERDHASGREAEGGEAMRRLLVRASAPGGLVSLYSGIEAPEGLGAGAGGDASGAPASAETTRHQPLRSQPPDLLSLGGELIACVERAAAEAGLDFAPAFRATRLELADDYAFLDPSTGRFQYARGHVQLHAPAPETLYLRGVCECLRRVVERLARSERGDTSLREEVALELGLFARRRHSTVERLQLAPQLDRIAGVRVL